MKPSVRKIYFGEAEKQCEFAFQAAQHLNFTLAQLSAPISDEDWETRRNILPALQREVFRSIHSFLTHASNVSRLFWPPPARKKKGETAEQLRTRDPQIRGSALREFAAIPEPNALSDRTLRDHLEHFDERLDDWALNSARRNFIQDIIGPANTISIDPPFDAGDCMRWFDPQLAVMRFRGGVYHLQPMADALQDIRTRCLEALRRDDASIADERALERERVIEKTQSPAVSEPAPVPKSDG